MRAAYPITASPAAVLAILLAGCASVLAGCASGPARQSAPPSSATVRSSSATSQGPQPAVAVQGRAFRVAPAESLLTIRVYKGGALARAGHNHVIASHDLTGVVHIPEDLRPDTVGQSSFELHMPVGKLTVDEDELRAGEGPDFPAGVPADAKDGTRRNMLGAALLEGDRYPDIVLQSEAIQQGPDGLQAQIRVIVRDRASSVIVPLKYEVQGDALTAEGEFPLKQTDLGLTPYSLLGGALKVVDEMKIRFRVVAHAEAAG